MLWKTFLVILFIFGCAGSLWLHGLSLVVAGRVFSLIAVCGLLIVVASVGVEHKIQGTRLQ